MKENNNTPIFVEDPKIGGYTVFFKELPNIVSESETIVEALKNLENSVYDVQKYQKK